MSILNISQSRMRMITQNLLIFIVLAIFPQSSLCLNPICSPSACGSIRNISYPFRLINDPPHCGSPIFELTCENNVTAILDLNSQKYKVKEINYINQTIWLVDVYVNNNICSFPNASFNNYFIYHRYRVYGYSVESTPITWMRCPYPLKNSSVFTHCPTSHSSSTHTYIKVGHLNASQVRDNCSVEVIALTSWKFKDLENVSVSEIHQSLLSGFQLYWYWIKCTTCKGRKCVIGDGRIVTCRGGLVGKVEELWENMKHPPTGPDNPSAAVILILLFILVVFFAGISLPAKIILGFFCAWGFIQFQTNEIFNQYWHISHRRLLIVLFFSVRFVIVSPFIIWFFIYKFRRRHLSRYDKIEDFLKSENQLMPIRYSYSDIKKMTRGFREKLGQGGYGTVYKGKLRSGYDVAVKLLGKPGGNGQDFMNEIGTIGRIHHVNVVKLVGYCAERSKRVLVFDFMPNGSLDKHIYDREISNRLSWERKYDIAIGVARGIEYLHKGCDIQILHFDIKPHNILLDDKFTPKITDFGLAKFFSTDKKVVTMTAVRGTIGYVAPELINRGFGEVSYKADVYSFGMLLMEMAGLNKDSNGNNQASTQYFPCWIYDCFEQGQNIDFGVTDENNDDDNNDANGQIGKKMTIVALWCIQMSPGDRPSMNKVVEMLEAPVERLRVPNRPLQSAQVAVNEEDQSWSTYSTDDSTSVLGQDAAPSIEITVED